MIGLIQNYLAEKWHVCLYNRNHPPTSSQLQTPPPRRQTARVATTTAVRWGLGRKSSPKRHRSEKKGGEIGFRRTHTFKLERSFHSNAV